MPFNNIEVHEYSRGALVDWNFPRARKDVYTRRTNKTRFCISNLQSGCRYVVGVRMLSLYWENKTIAKVQQNFKTVFSQNQLEKLYAKVIYFAGLHISAKSLIAYVHRCKPESYFDRLYDYMPKEIRAWSGHNACAINGEPEVKGLWFSTATFRGDLPNRSPFGNTLFYIRPELIIDDVNSFNLYFTDFYCITQRATPHYVTLVLCKKYSGEDEFCKQHLKRLDLSANPFFEANYDDYGDPNFWACTSVYVELFITETVSLYDGNRKYVTPAGEGSRVGGCRHNANCGICNL
ncbi:hypothetical protein M3Y96_00882300 [Aphelenchoides besseyi]|nr:hypothetical protein M3Y96_00882300 [Aphelenchoides besseyi]